MGEAYRTWIILYCTKALFACVTEQQTLRLWGDNCGVCMRTGGLWEKSSTSIEAWRSTVLRFRTEAVTMSQMMTLMGLT